MYDGERLQELLAIEKNQKLKHTISTLATGDCNAAFKELISYRDTVDLEAYAMYVRMLTQTDTEDVPLDILLKAHEGLTHEDLMSKEELEKFKELPETLEIYRGTDPLEYPPRISWSLSKNVARRFDQGQMYKATINKSDIIAYYFTNGDEDEILAHVTENFDDIL